MKRPSSASPEMPVPNLHRQVPQYLARRFWQIAATLQSEALAPFGLMPWQVALIAQISATPGQDRNWLAAAIGIDATSTGQALTLFEARGLVRREPNPADRRANAFSLTPAGAALRAEMAGPVRDVARRLLSPLSEAEGETLLLLLSRVVDSHQVFARPGAGRRPPRRANQKGETT
ncbi:MAG: winged helix-turn-helix transcriptional regulator [Roseomonas sp.]|nr:winged helix-turn-helix transcriptional regulator [Roseomonas sp.]